MSSENAPTVEETSVAVPLDEYGRLMRLQRAAVALSQNFETYGSVIKVTVPMALLEKLQQELSTQDSGVNQ